MAHATKATGHGGRNDRAMLDDGGLAFAMSAPKEIGGAGNSHNAEHLFALGYSSNFGQAILFLVNKRGFDGQAAKVTCEVKLNTDGGFSLAAELKVPPPGTDKDRLQALVEHAHQVCSYSKVTRSSMPVTLIVV